jgi:hypothetical protein
VLDLQLHGVLQRIGFHMQPRRISRRLLGNQQLIVDRLDVLTGRRPGERKNPGVKEPRKSCRPRRLIRRLPAGGTGKSAGW